MSDQLIIRAEETGAERPVAQPETPVTDQGNLDKALKDTKAELTRVQQELAALKKGSAQQDSPPQDAPPADDLSIPDAPAEDGGDTQEDQVVPGISNEAFAPWTEEYNKTGDVAPESRSKIVELLTEKGFAPDLAKTLVDDYVESAKVRDANAKAAAENNAKSLKDSVGGDAAYVEMVQWASKNLSEAERAAYDKAVTSGDMAAASLAVSGLQAKFKAANRGNPKVIQGKAAPPTDGDTYKSMYEVSQDMKKDEYKKDPAFRAKVQAKLARSSLT